MSNVKIYFLDINTFKSSIKYFYKFYNITFIVIFYQFFYFFEFIVKAKGFSSLNVCDFCIKSLILAYFFVSVLIF